MSEERRRLLRELGRESLLRVGAAVAASLAAGLGYALPVAASVDFPRPLPDQVLMGIWLGLTFAGPVAAWAGLRAAVHALVVLARRPAVTPPEPATLGALLREAFFANALFLLLVYLGVDATVGPIFFPGEQTTSPAVLLALHGGLPLAGLLALHRGVRPLCAARDRSVALGMGALLFGLVLTHAAWGAARWALRPEVPTLEAQPAPAPQPTGLRVIVAGLDGASWEILDAMIADGEMPRLKETLGKGARMVLHSEEPFHSPSLWITMSTGWRPAEHGVTSYLSTRLPGCRISPKHDLRIQWLYPFHGLMLGLIALEVAEVAPTHRENLRAPTLWDRVSATGGMVNILNWWGTYPAPPVHGNLISDAHFREWMWMVFPPRRMLTTLYPPELRAEVEPLIADPGALRAADFADYGEFNDHDRADLDARLDDSNRKRSDLTHMKWGTAVAENVFRVALHLHRRAPADLTMLLVGVEDNIQHHFAPYRWPERFRGVDPEHVRRYRRVLNAHHRRLDGWLAGLFELANERTVILLVSDHGYEFLPDNPLTPEAHAKEGVLFALGGPVRAGASGLTGSVYDVAPTVLHLLGHPAPEGWSGRALTELFDEGFLARHPPRRE